MKNTLVSIVLCSLIVGLWTGCTKKYTLKPSGEPDEKLIWSTHDKRPGWTAKEPKITKKDIAFVGLSSKYATEKEARDDALRTTTNNAVKYIGAFAQDKFERLQTSYDLSTEIVDPTNVTRRLEEHLSAAFVTRIKTDEWYIEKWHRKRTKETYIIAFLKANVPKASIEKAYEEICNSTIGDLKKKRDEANEAKAKAQFENAMKAFEKAKEQGFSFEK